MSEMRLRSLLRRARNVISEVTTETLSGLRLGTDTDEQVMAYRKGVDYEPIDHETILEGRRWSKLVAEIDAELAVSAANRKNPRGKVDTTPTRSASALHVLGRVGSARADTGGREDAGSALHDKNMQEERRRVVIPKGQVDER